MRQIHSSSVSPDVIAADEPVFSSGRGSLTTSSHEPQVPSFHRPPETRPSAQLPALLSLRDYACIFGHDAHFPCAHQSPKPGHPLSTASPPCRPIHTVQLSRPPSQPPQPWHV
ncbi:unnamed protein product [Protopolystoma xenopodis]|uniref:Uncharacterized protein n=1 Tax=Protopolystoma xenopodis TaxID=117903 RepID=A0A3S5B289_9PLAT|nr:unnamed protein product [Protopolystoma xenopodis]